MIWRLFWTTESPGHKAQGKAKDNHEKSGAVGGGHTYTRYETVCASLFIIIIVYRGREGGGGGEEIRVRWRQERGKLIVIMQFGTRKYIAIWNLSTGTREGEKEGWWGGGGGGA